MSLKFAGDVVTDGVRGHGENIILGILAGIVAAALGAVLWMTVAITTNLRGGLVALAIGALVGFAVRFAGNGRGIIFGIIGGVLTLLGCFGGEVLTVVQLSTNAERDFYQAMTSMDLGQLCANILDRTDALMYLIYAVGVFEGYKISIRK
jgi:hypothetical protein